MWRAALQGIVVSAAGRCTGGNFFPRGFLFPLAVVGLKVVLLSSSKELSSTSCLFPNFASFPACSKPHISRRIQSVTSKKSCSSLASRWGFAIRSTPKVDPPVPAGICKIFLFGAATRLTGETRLSTSSQKRCLLGALFVHSLGMCPSM